jgi:hypothetical protein
LQAINSATRDVCDVSWIDYWAPNRSSPERASADRAMDEAILRFSTHNLYREIYVIDSKPTPNRKVRLEKLRARTKDANNGYYCAYFAEANLPRFQFMIVDDEVILHTHDGESSDVRCAVRHPEFAKLFRAYYTLLWRAATILKDHNGPVHDLLEQFLANDTPPSEAMPS